MPTFFATPSAFGTWLRANGSTALELVVGFYKKDSGCPSITWPESVDEALCVGWIDGIRRRIDASAYSIRFTPRKKTSSWSAVNIGRVQVLIAEGRMRPAGLAAFTARREAASAIYAYEQPAAVALSAAEAAQFRAKPKAWRFFESQAPSYQKRMLWQIVSAKRPETRAKRLAALIAASATGERL